MTSGGTAAHYAATAAATEGSIAAGFLWDARLAARPFIPASPEIDAKRDALPAIAFVLVAAFRRLGVLPSTSAADTPGLVIMGKTLMRE